MIWLAIAQHLSRLHFRTTLFVLGFGNYPAVKTIQKFMRRNDVPRFRETMSEVSGVFRYRYCGVSYRIRTSILLCTLISTRETAEIVTTHQPYAAAISAAGH